MASMTRSHFQPTAPITSRRTSTPERQRQEKFWEGDRQQVVDRANDERAVLFCQPNAIPGIEPHWCIEHQQDGVAIERDRIKCGSRGPNPTSNPNWKMKQARQAECVFWRE